MTLLETYKPMREYIIKYLNSKISFYSDIAIFNRLHRIEIHINCYSSNRPFKYFRQRLYELKVNFIIEPSRGFEDEYIVLKEDEYLKLYTLLKLRGDIN